MIEARKPANEIERIGYLRQMQILDTPLEERFERITRIVCRSLDVPISAISLVDQERQWFKSIQGISASETSRSSAFCAHTILDSKPFIIENALEDERFVDNPLVTDSPNIRFYAGIPLEVQDGIRIGSLCAIDVHPREVTEEHISTLKDLAEMVKSELASVKLSVANLELLRDLEQAERAAVIDPLTRVWNRSGGEKLLEREWEFAKRNSKPISVALLDLDHFKNINDQFGHDVGDEVLRSFARSTLTAIRPNDSFCRWGGEEFLLILPECEIKDLRGVLDRILHATRNNKSQLPFTASIGAISLVPSRGGDLRESLRNADAALYKAKRSGRDQYCVVPCQAQDGGSLQASYPSVGDPFGRLDKSTGAVSEDQF